MYRGKLEPVIPRYANVEDERSGLRAVPKNGRFISLTNSERTLAACPKRWWFRYGERLDRDAGPAARLGTAFHEVMEDIWGWWQDYDTAYPLRFVEHECIRCHALALVAERWRADFVDCDEPIMTHDEWLDQVSRLRGMVRGYLIKWGELPPAGFKVIAVELTLTAPLMDGDKPFKTNVPVVDDGGEIRLASLPDMRAGLSPKMVRWPWYQVGRVDGLLQHRDTGALWILEHKTSRSPQSYFEALSLDPQTTGYVWMLKSMCERGLFGDELQNHPNPVAGFLYDVISSSNHHSPTLLKSGELSRAKGKNVPSWLYRDAIKENSLDPADYEDAVQHCVSAVDSKLYQREFGSPGDRALARYEKEILGVADRHGAMRRNLVNGSDQDREFPRVPVCVRGFCSYKGICINDTPEGREQYVEGSVQRWRVPGVEKEPDEGTTKVDDIPF